MKNQALTKELTLFGVFCIASGAMISSGLFILPGLAYAKAGPGVIISYFISGLLALTGALSVAEMVTAMPKAGGDYFFITRTMGPEIGMVSGLLSWFALSLKSAFALVGMSAFAAKIINLDINTLAIILCVIFTLINIIGIKEAGKIQVILVMALIILMAYFLILGFPQIDVLRLAPFAPKGWSGIFAVTGFVFVSYGGLLKVASVSEEVKNPGKNIPAAMFYSLAIVGFFYVAMVFVTVGVLEPQTLSESLTPISDAAEVFLGPVGRTLLDIAAILSFVTTANAGIMSASRYPLALSRDGLLPKIISRINDRFRTPHVSILLTAVFMIFFLLLKLDALIKSASTVLILTYILSIVSIIVLRESRLHNYQPSFKSPCYPWLQIAGLLGFEFLIYEIGMWAFILSLVFITGSFLLYWFVGKRQINREFALLHLIERITAKELTTRSLESELKDIIKERDAITKDRFDRVIENAIIIDIENAIDSGELFDIVAENMAPRINIKKQILYDLLIKREKESSTAITPFLAIPHIIVNGEKIFDIMIARCNKGIKFSETACSVKTVFVLIGTKDERNFHLRALSAIAQIVQDKTFGKKWNHAKSKEDLRDTILLIQRHRF